MGRRGFVWAVVAMVVVTVALTRPAWTIDPSRLVNADKDPNSWLSYNGTYKGWRYSPLDQINRGNVKNLKVAWIFQPGMPATEQGLEGTPLAVDGIVYLSGSYSRVWALDGATGKVLWHHYPKTDQELRQRQTHVPYNRGLAVGHGNVYVGTIDGRLIALDMKSGKEVWAAQLIDSKKETIGFTGAPLVVKNMVVIGSQAGEWSTRGRIFAVDAKTGKERWKFWTIPSPEDDPEANKTWGGDSWKVGGGGGWMTGSFDPELNLIYWGTGNPSPLYDWAADDWMTKGPRPGTNLYVTSVLALDADSGKLKWYFQELPHDPWDFDSSVGELLMVERDGKKLLVHANKGGPVFVWDRTNGQVVNAYMGNHIFNFVKGVDPKSGKLIEPWYPKEGKTEFLCPWIAGAYGWNSGAFSPKTGLWYKIVQEGCMDLDIKRTAPVTDPVVGLNFGAEFTLKGTPNGPAYGHLDARDPVTGQVKWSVNYPIIPIGSLLATGGDLVFLGDFEGWVHAHDAEVGTTLWSFNNGSGHRGGIISYTAGGKQYIAVASGLGSLVADDFAKLWPERVGHYAHSAAVVVFTLP